MVLRQERYFSTRFNYANKKIREFWLNLVNTKYNSTEDVINKLQELKGEPKKIFFKNLSNYHDNLNIKIGEDPFAKNAHVFSNIYHGVLLLIKFLQTKPLNLRLKI